MIRKQLISYALSSFASLQHHLMELSAREVDYALELEHKSQNRKAIIERLIKRRVKQYEEEMRTKLTTEYLDGQK